MPSRAPSPIAAPATVVVTGANGFIGQHCVAALLSRGYHVVGTVRSPSKINLVKKTHNAHPKLDVVVIADITSTQSCIDALSAFAPAAILHVAAPFHYKTSDFETDLMIPSVRGTLAVLEAATHLRTVKRVVQTSSFASIYDAAAGLCPEKKYTARHWSPLTYQDGLEAPNPQTAYRASKTAAEMAAWQFMKTQRPSFDMVSICPAMTFGPFLPHALPKNINELNTSNHMVWAVVSAGAGGPVPPTKGPIWVDVRDAAEAHVRALLTPEAGGERYMVANGVYCNQEIADLSREVLPKLQGRLPLGEPGRRESDSHFGVDIAETERALGMTWRSLDQCLEELVPQLFEIAGAV